MRRIAIVLCDVGASIVAIGWARIGPWDRILGFNFYHSRGDVWLPTPPAAAAFFRAMVSTGILLFAIFFLLASFLIFYVGQSSDDQPRGIFQRMFYGDARTLLVKYFAILFISFISPFFYNWMWRVPVSHALRIAGGSAISIAMFIVVLAIAGLRVSHRVTVPTGS